MNIRKITGSGGKITGFTLPFALAGIILNVLYPQRFKMNTGLAGIFMGSVLLCLGIPFWLISVVQMLKYVPQDKLITKGPFSLVLHPIYTSVALLVIPGLAFVFDTWVLLLIGGILYIISRIFRGEEDKKLEGVFSKEYETYRSKVIIPWL
jgi:protein-S-isoprenylcysteine O-methyltransferase Ste14